MVKNQSEGKINSVSCWCTGTQLTLWCVGMAGNGKGAGRSSEGDAHFQFDSNSKSPVFQVVRSQCTALLNQELRGVSDIGFSSCTAPDYLILMSKYLRCVPWCPRMSRSYWKLSRSSEVNLELSIVQREVSVEVKNKARALEVTGLILEVQNRGLRGSRQG